MTRSYTPLRKGEHPKDRQRRERREDLEATAVLEAAGGECAVCHGRPPALKAIFEDHPEGRRRLWSARCVDYLACDRRFRASLLEDDE